MEFKHVLLAIGLLALAALGLIVKVPGNPWDGMSTGTGAGNVSCGVNLDTAGATYTMNASSTINGANCFNITANNVTLDCNGYTLTGNNITATYGIYITSNNNVVKNCNVNSFFDAVNILGSNGNNISNSNFIGYTASTFVLSSASNNTMSNLTIRGSGSNGIGLNIYFGTGNVIKNSYIAGTHAAYGAIFFQNNRGITIANSTIDGLGGSYGGVFRESASNNILINNTFVNATNFLYWFNSLGGNNTFCLNNFTASSGAYITDTNGTNFYNCTYDGKNQGNAYANVLNGSINVTGNVSSSIAGLYIGTNGSGVPYNNSTSAGKFSCNFAGCGDYAPLTSSNGTAPTYANLTVLTTTGGSAVGNASNLTIPATSPINATASANYIFVNWSVSGAGCSVLNASNPNTLSNLTVGNCNVTANFATICRTLTSSYTMPASATTTDTCFTINAANVVLDCNGYNINGSENINYYGVYSTQSNTTVKNCNITHFENGVYFVGASNGAITNNTITITNNHTATDPSGYMAPIELRASSNSNTIANNTLSTTYGVGMLIYGSCNGNVLTNNTIIGTNLYGYWISASDNNILSGASIGGMTGAVYITSTSTGNTIANSSINGYGGIKGIEFQDTANGNIIANNTIKNATWLLSFLSQAGGNFVYLNNFSNGTYYVNDSNGSNKYNYTYASKNQGNAYANVLNGSISVVGNVSSSLSGLYIGTSGAVPYNNSTSGGKFVCGFAGCGDYAPLTSTNVSTFSCGALSTAGTTYTMTQSLTSSATCFNVTAANITLDCSGYSIYGNNSAASYGVYSNQTNTTIKNCIIGNYTNAIYLTGIAAGSGDDSGGTITYSGGYTIHTFKANGTYTVNSNHNVRVLVIAGGAGGDGGVNGLYYGSGGAAGTVLENTSYAVTTGTMNVTVGDKGIGANAAGTPTNGTNSSFGTIVARGGYASQSNDGGANALFSGGTMTNPNAGGGAGGNGSGSGSNGGAGYNSSINGTMVCYSGGGGGGRTGVAPAGCGGTDAGQDGQAANATNNSGGGGGGGNTAYAGGNGATGIVIITYQTLTGVTANAATIVNNTFIPDTAKSNTLVFVNSSTSTFCMNNFTNTSGLYVNDTIGGNFYNCTYNGSNQGNMWYNVLNGSVNITGTNNSSVIGLYIGAAGSGYPYNTTSAAGKISGSITDYAPLTPSLTGGNPLTSNLTVLCNTTQGTCTGNATNFNLPANKTITASANANFTFANFSLTSGNATINNTAVNSTFVIFLNTSSATVVTANFNELAKANLSISVTGSGTAGTNQSNYHVPATLPLNASPSAHWTFTNYTRTAGTCTIGNATNANTNVTITVAENCAITALFTEDPKGNITVSSGTGGTVSGNQTNAYFGSYTIIANANANYTFLYWIRTAGTCAISNNLSASTSVLLAASETCNFNASFNYTPTINNPPVVISLTVTASPYVTTPIDCTVKVADVEGTATNVTFGFYKNGIEQLLLGGTANNIPNNTLAVVGTVNVGNLTKGQNWSCYVIAFDGQYNSSGNMSANTTVLNSLPVIAYQINTITNSSTAHTFTAGAGVSDADGAGDISTTNSSSTLGSATHGSDGSSGIYFNTTYSYTSSTPGSSTVIIGFTDSSGAYVQTTGASNSYPDHTPTLSAPIVSAPLINTSIATYTPGTFTDTDGDTENVSARLSQWYMNGTLLAGQTNATLNLSAIGAKLGSNISVRENATNSTWVNSKASTMSTNVTIGNTTATINVGYGTGITGLSFRPIHAYAKNVEPVNQSYTYPLYMLNNTQPFTVQVKGSVSSIIPGFSMKCSATYLSSGAIALTNVSTNLSVLVPYNPVPSACYQETATVRGTCGALPTGTYGSTGTWQDGDWATNVTLNNSAVYVNYSVSTFASNATMQLKFGNATTTNTSNVSVWTCANNTSTAQFRLQYYNQSLGNGSDGLLLFTTGTKSYGNLATPADYNVSGNTLYLNLDRAYRFTNFTLGAGTTLATTNTAGTVMYITATGTAVINGTVDLTNTLTSINSSTVTIDGNVFYSTYQRDGGDGGRGAFGGYGGYHYQGYGGGGGGGHTGGAAGGNADGSTAAGGAGVSQGTCDYCTGTTYGNPGTSSSGGSGGLYWYSYGGGGASCSSPAGAASFGASATNSTAASGGTAQAIAGGSGGAGNIPGRRAPHFFMSASTLFINGTINVSGTSGSPGGNGGWGMSKGTWADGYGGGGGGGGGGADAGNIYLYFNAITNTGRFLTLAGPGGTGGIGGSATIYYGDVHAGSDGASGSAGTSGVNGTVQLGSSMFCYYNSTWNSMFQIPQTQYMSSLYEEGIYWTLAAQSGQGNLWCWADFNNPNPRGQSFNVSINGTQYV